MSTQSKCPKCGGEMQEGFVLESAHGSRSPTLWVAGPPEGGSLLGTKTSGKEQHPVQAFRCGGCGFSEMYARGS